uniref:T-cell immunoglobulin and mucin domain-containing protein 4 n=1 Tax=Lygus hesperus TaxID=30085 RepID=A0A0A9Y6A4_LYGHE
MVFDGGTWNPYPTYRGGGKPQNFKAVCQNKGEYLNLCGECVGGSSEKDDDYGLDSCGVCAGLERCGQTSCEDSIEDFELSENCTKIIGIRPKAIDMAVSSKGVIHLIGNMNTNNLLCSVYSDATELGAVTISETQWGLQFEFDLPKKEGRLDMHCNSTEGVVLRNSLLVVDSRKLQPLSSREKSIEYGKESYVTLSVANMISMVDLVCFARDQDGSVLYKAWSHDIQGNSLSSTVICDRIWPKKAGKMKFGVAYSAEAITSAKTLDIEVVSKDLTLHWASASKDKLALIFDQVLETYNDCGTLFKTISDKDAKCWSAGNKIMVKFKGSPKVKIGDTLEVLAASASVGIPESFSVKINGEIVSEQLSNLEIKGPKVICRNQKVTFDVDGSGVKWSLALPNNSASDGTMTPGNKQRKNMMMWRNVRETAKMMKADGTDNRMSLNTSLLTPGAEYQIKATLPDRQGKAMTLTKNFKIATHNGGEPMIKGPMNPSWTNEALYELDNPLCGPKSDDLKYEWVIGTENEAMIQQTGSKIHLKPGVLSSNTKYNVTVRLMNSSQLVSEVALEVFAQPATLKAATYVDEIVYGTGHKILLLGNSEVLPTKSVGAKYRWSCESETGYCAMPGKELKSIETLGGFDNSVLVLPPGSLPVGSYLFTLNVSLTSGESTLKTTRVRIVPGEPTLLSLVSVDFGESLKIILQAKDIIGECEINLESLKSVNTSYLDLSEMIETDILKGTPSDPQSKTLVLDVPFEKLVYGTSYMFRLIGDCGALSQSWLVFTIPIPEKSASCVLHVAPMSGVALSTEFTFQVTDCYPNNPIYSFGYVLNDKVHYLSSTLDSQKKLFSFPGNLKPVMKICEPDKMCAVYFAENITVDTAPVDIEVARTVVVTMSDDLNSGHFEEVLGTTALLLESCKSEPDILNNVSDSILQIIVNKIQDVSAEIDQGGPVTSQTLELLQCALGVVEAAKGSDEVITVILRFCDKIEEKAKTTGVDLPDQRPSKRNKRSFSVTKRETNQNIQKVESLLKAYSYGIQNFKDKIEAKAKSALLLEKIPGMAVDMCNTLSKNAKPVHVESPVAELSTIRIIIGPRESKVNLTLPECLDTCSNSSLQIVMNEQVLEEMNHTDVCLGVNYIQDDYYSETRNATSELNITRLSGVYKSMVFKYDGDKAANLTFNRSKLSLATIRIPIRNTTIPKDTELKCHLWKNDFGWNFSPCETLKRTFISKVQALECRCPFPGVYAVFLIPESETKKVVPIVPPAKPEVTQIVTTLPTTTIATPPTTIPTTAVTTKIPTTLPTTAAPNATTTNKTAAVTPQEATKPVTTTQQTTTLTSSTPHPVTAASPSLSPENYRVAASFMIDENFNETVGVKKQEFENSIKTQLIKSVQIPDHAKVDALNSNAKIKVVINMRYAEKTDMSKLQQLLKSGDLKLHGLNNTELKVTEQDLELVLGQKDGRSSTFAVVSTAIFISLTFILAILLSGMFLKWKRQQRALSFVQNMEVSAPRYLRLHEESSVDNLERNYGSTDNLRSADLDSGIVLTVDPNRMSTKYHTGNSSSSGHPRA